MVPFKIVQSCATKSAFWSEHRLLLLFDSGLRLPALISRVRQDLRGNSLHHTSRRAKTEGWNTVCIC